MGIDKSIVYKIKLSGAIQKAIAEYIIDTKTTTDVVVHANTVHYTGKLARIHVDIKNIKL